MAKTDVALIRDENNLYDVEVDASTGDLQIVEGFQTSFQLSAFMERRAYRSEIAAPRLRRGWVGNLVGPFAEDGFEWGSKLWLLEQARNTAGTLNFAVDALRKALQWFIDESIVQTITVTGTSQNSEIILRAVMVSAESETETVLFNVLKETVSGAGPTRL